MHIVRFLVVVLILFTASLGIAADSPRRVLILGDRVYQEPAREIAKVLKGQVEVVFHPLQPGEVRNTTWALANLDVLLGNTQWDLIYFNFGLGDLVYRAPGMKTFRVMPKDVGGVRATSPSQYEKNLDQITERLKATGAVVIWGNTTPIRSTPNGIFELGSELEYNAIAKKVMTNHKIPIHDMHHIVTDLIDMKRPAPHGWDPFFFDRQPLHPPMVRLIASELKLKSMPN